MSEFKLTYATMFNPPESLNSRFDQAIKVVKDGWGKEHGMYINGEDVYADIKVEDLSPINTSWHLATGGRFGGITQLPRPLMMSSCSPFFTNATQSWCSAPLGRTPLTHNV